MVWVKLDDEFPDHPKVVAAGPLAGWLFICGLAYCNRFLTDGKIPKSVAYRLANFDHIGLETAGVPGLVSVGADVDCEWMAGILVHEGLWEEHEFHFLVHDFFDYQPSKAEVEEEKEKKREAGRLGGLRSGEKRRSQAKTKQMLQQTPEQPLKQEPSTRSSKTEAGTQAKTKPVPVPVPEPVEAKADAGSEEKLKGKDIARDDALPAEKELLAVRLMAAVPDLDRGVLDHYAAELPQSSLAKVLESVLYNPTTVRGGYVIAALKSEIEERVA